MTTPAAHGPEAQDDEQLVAAFTAGDQEAFDVLVSRYERRVFAICYRYFGNVTDAEDAAQEVFIALLRRAGSFSATSKFSTWMYRVATNACHDLARKRARRPQAADADVTQAVDVRASHPSAEQVLHDADLDPGLVAALDELDDATREAIVLHDVYGVGYAEIADRAQVAVGTVKSRIHRGHAQLERALSAALGPVNGDGNFSTRPDVQQGKP